MQVATGEIFEDDVVFFRPQGSLTRGFGDDVPVAVGQEGVGAEGVVDVAVCQETFFEIVGAGGVEGGVGGGVGVRAVVLFGVGFGEGGVVGFLEFGVVEGEVRVVVLFARDVDVAAVGDAVALSLQEVTGSSEAKALFGTLGLPDSRTALSRSSRACA